MAAPAGGGGALPPAAATGDEADAGVASNGVESEADAISVAEDLEEDGVDGSEPAGEEPSPRARAPLVSLDVTDAAISKDELAYQLDGSSSGARPMYGRCVGAGVRQCMLRPICMAEPLLPTLPRRPPPAGGGTPKKDAPCIVLPHQSDYVPHIALDIGAR